MNLNIPSISAMSKENINQFPVITNWKTDRTLMSQPIKFGELYLPSYEAEIGTDGLFNDTFNNLTNKDIYLDVGAGNGKAMMAYRKAFPQGAKVIGVASSISDEQSLQTLIEQDKTDDQFSYYLCDFVDFPVHSLAGRVSDITDILGATRYSGKPAQVIQQMGTLLKEGGLAFIKFTGADGVIPPLEHIVCGGCSHRLFQYWFHTIKGFDVIQDGMDLEKSKIRNEEISTDIETVKHTNSGNKVILRRNADPVEVDTLTPTQEKDKDVKFIASWNPVYQWDLSERCKSLLEKDNHRPVRLY